MSLPRIRPMVPQDWENIADIYGQGIATGIATFQTEVPSWEVWDAGHRKDARIVAEKDGEVIGFATLSFVSVRECYHGVAEVSIYIDESARGQGIGKLLLTRLIALSEEIGVWTLQSSIDRENAASIKLHESCGFRMIGFRERIACIHKGEWRDTVLMERRSKSIGN